LVAPSSVSVDWSSLQRFTIRYTGIYNSYTIDYHTIYDMPSFFSALAKIGYLDVYVDSMLHQALNFLNSPPILTHFMSRMEISAKTLERITGMAPQITHLQPPLSSILETNNVVHPLWDYSTLYTVFKVSPTSNLLYSCRSAHSR